MRTCFIIGLLLLFAAGITTAQTESNPRFQISVNGGGTWYDMKNINTYMKFANAFGLPSDQLYGGPSFGADLDIYFGEHVSFGIGVDYVWEEASADFIFDLDDAATRVVADMDVSYVAPYFSLKYHNLMGSWDYFIGLGASYILGNAKISIDTAGGSLIDVDIDENGLGGFAVAGASYEFAPPFTLGGQFGYRYYNAGELDDPSLDLLDTYTGLQVTPELDFSGPFIAATLGMRF